jgi:hypothetical protein
VHKGIGPNRQGTSERSRAIDGRAWASGDASGADCESSSSAAQVTSLAALRLLAIFKTLFSFACTAYSLPILTIE